MTARWRLEPGEVRFYARQYAACLDVAKRTAWAEDAWETQFSLARAKALLECALATARAERRAKGGRTWFCGSDVPDSL